MNDGSTDDTLAVVTAVTREYHAPDRVTVLSLPANVGVTAALNEGVLPHVLLKRARHYSARRLDVLPWQVHCPFGC